MNSEPLISVIMPSYNSALTIRRAVLSVARQTYKNTEIIVVDNSSADNTAEAVKEMQAELGGRLKLIVQPNTGVSSARNTGIREAKGEYFVSLDSDDYYEPETIRTLYEALTGDASDVAICGMRKVYEDGETPNEELAPEGRFKGTLKEFLGSSFTALYDLHLIQTHSNKLYKAEVIRNGSIYYNEELAVNEDIDFVMRYLAACERVSVVQDIFLNYVQHKKGQSLINTFQPHGLKGALIVLGSWMKLSGKTGTSEETMTAMDERLFVHICSFAGLMYYRSDFSDERIREELEMMCDDPGFEALLKRYKPSGLKNIAACFMLKSKMIPLYHFMCKGLYSSKK